MSTRQDDKLQDVSGAAIRPYRAGDESRIVQLLQTVFGRWPGFHIDCEALEHWHWRYRDNPGSPAVIVVYESDGVIAGCVHSAPVTVKLGEQEFSACLGGDTALLKAYRGQRLVGPFFRFVVELRRATGIQFSFGETRSPALLKSLRKSSYALPVDARHLVKIESVSKYLHQRGHRWSRLKAAGFHFLSLSGKWTRRSHVVTHDDSLAIDKVNSFDQRFETFFQQVSKDYDWIVKRDCAYLNWRYTDSRAGNYEIFTVQSKEQLLGYAVSRIDQAADGVATGYVVDLLCLNDRVIAANALLSHVLNSFHAKGIGAIHGRVARDHPYYELYVHLGFRDSMERTTVFLRFTDPMPREVALLENRSAGTVHYCYGDIDSI